MKLLSVLAALALVTAPVLAAPNVARADGIERQQPRPRPRVRPRPQPRVEAPPAPVPLRTGPEEVRLSDSFFAGSGGGVGADISTNFTVVSSTVVVRGGQASASAFASARASAGARAGGGFRGGHHGGGCGCR
jgi:hypothetical protein